MVRSEGSDNDKKYLDIGKKDGLETSWNELGQKEKEELYEDGELVSETAFQRDGIKKSLKNYRHERQHGVATTWHESGNKESETFYEEGLENGLRIEWSEDGKKTYEANFVDGNEQ